MTIFSHQFCHRVNRLCETRDQDDGGVTHLNEESGLESNGYRFTVQSPMYIFYVLRQIESSLPFMPSSLCSTSYLSIYIYSGLTFHGNQSNSKVTLLGGCRESTWVSQGRQK